MEIQRLNLVADHYPAGNIEYLLWLGMESEIPLPDLEAIKQITQSATTDLRKN